MLNTKNQPDWFGNEEFMRSKARGYQPDGSGGFDGFNEVPWSYITIYPAGALRGTAEDLALLAMALMPPLGESGPLFSSSDTLDLMLSPGYFNPEIMLGTHHGFMSFGVVLLSNANGGMFFNEKVLDLLRRHEGNLLQPLNFIFG